MFTDKNVFPPFPAQELACRHFRHGLITHGTVRERMRAEQEDGRVKRVCVVPEKRICTC